MRCFVGLDYVCDLQILLYADAFGASFSDAIPLMGLRVNILHSWHTVYTTYRQTCVVEFTFVHFYRCVYEHAYLCTGWHVS